MTNNATLGIRFDQAMILDIINVYYNNNFD